MEVKGKGKRKRKQRGEKGRGKREEGRAGWNYTLPAIPGPADGQG